MTYQMGALKALREEARYYEEHINRPERKQDEELLNYRRGTFDGMVAMFDLCFPDAQEVREARSWYEHFQKEVHSS